MKINSPKRFVEKMRGKIIIVVVFVLCSLALIWFVNLVAFKKISTIVTELSQPNEKLLLSRKLFTEVGNLTHLQRTELMEGDSKPSSLFTGETKRIKEDVSTLKKMLKGEPGQLQRLDSITTLMRLGNRLFLEHLKLRNSIATQKEFETQLNALSEKMDEEQLQVDTSVVTSEKKIKITTILPADSVIRTQQKKSWLKKIFSKRIKDSVITARPQVTIEEHVNTTTDTLSVAKRDTSIAVIGTSLKKIEKKRKEKNSLLVKSEQQLLLSNDVLLNQVINILSEVEKEETKQVREKTNSTVLLADDTINLTKAITIAFIILVLMLTTLIFVDITRSRTYRSQLEMARNEAEYHSMAKQRFLANMSHEIRTPLQSILGYSELELNQRKPGDENIGAIHTSAGYLLQIVNEVLDYSRIVSGKFSFENKLFSVGSVVEEVVAGMHLQAAAKWLQLQTDTVEINKDENVKGDAFRLKQVLYNLLGNAIKFTEKGAVKLTVRQSREGGHVHYTFVVTDTGVGMKPQDLSIIFNQFEQAENTATMQNGTGLGLSIVKELVEAQQGSISVQSTPGKGSVFTVELSFLHSPDPLPVPNSKAIAPVYFTGKVWLVDDDPLILRLAAALLKKHQVRHEVFDSAEKLLARPWDDAIQIIFTDLRLTGISGVELCRQLRLKIPATVKIIALTAQVLPEDKQALLQNGFDGLLLKPFSESALVEMLVSQHALPIQSHTIDLQNLKNMIGDEAQVQAILQQCFDDTGHDMEQLAGSLKTFDPDKTSLIIHRLAGRLGQMGDKISAARLRKTEIAIRSMTDWDSIRKETGNIEATVSGFLNALQNELKVKEAL